MKMKNLFLGLSFLAIAGLWTGCSNEQVIDGSSLSGKQEISFRLQGSMPDTRATATTPTYVDAFAVYGTDDGTATTGMIFDGVTVALTTGGAFDYNPKQYYGIGATQASFFAYSPVNAGKNMSAWTPGTSFTSNTTTFVYEVPHNIDAAGGTTIQEDFLVVDTVIAPSSSAVSLEFHHALSRIFVKATNALNETVVIRKLTLKRLNSKGLFTVTPTGTGYGWGWGWSSQTEPQDYVYALAETGVAVKPGVGTATLVTSMEQGMMVLPQTTVNENDDEIFDANDFALEVEYDVANLTGEKAYILLEDGYDFKAGQQYAITINYEATANLIEIKFTIDIDAFGAPIEVDYP